MPARAVENERGVRARRDGFRDDFEMFIHGFGIGVGHHDPSAHGALRADGAEQIGPFIARIAQCAGPCSYSRPNPGQRPFLANAGFILEPDLNWFCLGVLRQKFP